MTTQSLDQPSIARIAQKQQLKSIFRKYGMLLVLVLLIAILTAATPRFMTTINIRNLSRQISITALIAAGETLVILTGNIDLSVGAVIGLSGLVSAGVLRATDDPALAIACGLGTGAIVGLLNGTIVAKGKVAAFIVTLGTLTITNGVILLYSEARPIPVQNEIFTYLGQGRIRGVPVPIVVAVLVYFTLWLLLTRTRFGLYIYAMGGNEEATRLAGIYVERWKIATFLVAGVLAGLAGVVLTARLGSGVPTLGVGFELTAITAVVLGGTSLSGGEGGIWGTLIGAAIVEVIANGLNLLNVNAYYQPIATGVVVLFAILADRMLSQSKK